MQSQYSAPQAVLHKDCDQANSRARLSVRLTSRLTLPITQRTQSIFFKGAQILPQEDLAFYCHSKYAVQPLDSNYSRLSTNEIFVHGVGVYSTRYSQLLSLKTPIRSSFSKNFTMTTRPGIPGLQTANLPALSEEAASATASPARGREMRNDVLQKLRVPQFIHVWDFWHGRPAASAIALTKLSNEEGIRNIKDMWEVFNNFDLAKLLDKDTIALFHHGVRPEWEDARNTRGGSWTFRVKAAHAPEFWKQLAVMAGGEILQNAVATQRASFNDEICGISYSPRGRLVKIAVWNRDGENEAGIERLKACVLENIPKELLPEGNMFVYYKKHSEDPEFQKVMGGK
ncbi:translation initiation factor eIF4e [Pseudovirgaria hyperparasitica]|uniref:Translation initiation factor eIF4e n=1 Tax=Pseudovirgaria hyperparasitica TaxID=470096 RepID=A0A6A6WK98_9PEZI|nr:translation initiation factor eIF4e [Pseudovirgaria hyperparasitica]KAF2762588.1 translation initiation factor eIF4e [Pseudovirgaria hyperparasitica]